MQKSVIQSLTDEPTLLAILETPRFKWLPRYRITEKRLEVKGATLNTLLRITEVFQEANLKGSIHDIINMNATIPARFLALAIHNKPGEPPAWLTHALMNDFSAKEIRAMVTIAYGRIGIEDFFTSMASIASASLMPTSTQDTTVHKQ